jgi:hypothetical protein
MSVHDRTTGTNPLVIWLVVLGVVVVGLGGWVVYDMFFASGAPNAELAQLVEDYEAAWMEADGEAFVALVTDDYTFEWDGRSMGVPSMRASIAVDDGFEVETTSEVWSSDGSTHYVSLAETVSSDSGVPGPDGMDGISTLTIVEDGDGYLIAQHVWFGPYR